MERGYNKWRTFEEIAESNSAIIVHPTYRENYRRKICYVVQEGICSRCFNLSSYAKRNFFREMESMVTSTMTTLVQGIIMKIKKGESDMYKLKCNVILIAIMVANRPRSFFSHLQI